MSVYRTIGPTLVVNMEETVFDSMAYKFKMCSSVNAKLI